MTTQEFLEYASAQPLYNHYHGLYKNGELDTQWAKIYIFAKMDCWQPDRSTRSAEQQWSVLIIFAIMFRRTRNDLMTKNKLNFLYIHRKAVNMTRWEFLEQAAEQAGFYNVEDIREDIQDDLRKKCGGADMDFLFNFLYKNGFKGSVYISRFEKRSDDKLCIDISGNHWKTCFWEDIGKYASRVAVISNCAFIIEEFYISQDGRFWDGDHKLRFEREEELFDYLMTVEYDYHPVISEKTYEMLRHFGWYEGRRVDTTELEKELKKHGITLTEIQLDAIREFGGLEFRFSCSSQDQEFYTPEEMIERINNDDLDFDPAIYDIKHNIWEKNALEIGSTDVPSFLIDEDGKIFVCGCPSSRTVMEYIYSVCEHLDEDAKWL